MKNIISLIKKNKQLILYLIFGVLTTLINIAVYWLMAHPLSISTVPSTIVAWLVGVIFAFFTNKFIVFEAREKKRFLIELGEFFLARALTGVLDIGIMFIFVDILLLNDMVIKVISNIIVIVLNYLFSKFIIFKRSKQKNSEDD